MRGDVHENFIFTLLPASCTPKMELVTHSQCLSLSHSLRETFTSILLHSWKEMLVLRMTPTKKKRAKKLEMIFMEIRKSAVEMNIGWEWFYSTKGSIRKGCFRLYPKIKAQICMCLRTDCLLAFCHKSVTFDWINWTQEYANAWAIERNEKYTCPQQYVIHLPACSVFTTCLPYSWPLSLNIVHLSSFYPSYLSSEWMRYV